MRFRVLIAFFIIIAILTGGLYCRNKISQTCHHVENILLQQREQPDQETLNEAIAIWESSLPLLSTLLNHQPLEAFGRDLALAAGALYAGDHAHCLSQIEASLYLLDDIREYDYINWKTLF